MPLLYRPVDGSELADPVRPLPKSAFLMIHDNDRVAAVEARMQAMARAALKAVGFEARAASDLRRTGDFLTKIVRTIRGCGFGVAIFSDATSPQTLANIFFEVGYCLALGKPIHLLVAGTDAIPSDFVRSEWIEFKPGREDRFREALNNAFSDMHEYGEFLEDLALAAENAEEINPELAVERFKRAYLVSGRGEARDGIQRILTRLRAVTADAQIGRLMRSYRRMLVDDTSSFLHFSRNA